MNLEQFKSQLEDINANIFKQISDYFSLIYNYEKDIEKYTEQSKSQQLLIDNLLNYWIIFQISILQWYIESAIFLIEKYIIEQDVAITDLNKSIFSILYRTKKEEIIQATIYQQELKTGHYKNFLDINNNKNIILWRWTTNTIKYDNICEVFSLIWISIDAVVNSIEIVIDDLSKFYNRDFWAKYPIKERDKNEFLKKLIDWVSNNRHLLVHWKIENSHKDKIMTYQHIWLFREYVFTKFLTQLFLEIKYFIWNKKYLK